MIRRTVGKNPHGQRLLGVAGTGLKRERPGRQPSRDRLGLDGKNRLRFGPGQGRLPPRCRTSRKTLCAYRHQQPDWPHPTGLPIAKVFLRAAASNGRPRVSCPGSPFAAGPHAPRNERTERTSVFGPLGRAAVRNSRASTRCARRSPNPTDLAPWPIPKLARPLQRTQTLAAARIHRPTAQPFLPPMRTSIVPLLALPQIDPLLSHRLPGPAGLLPLEPRAPVLPPLVIASHRKAGFNPDPKLPKCSRCAQGLHAYAARTVFKHAQRSDCARLPGLSRSDTTPGHRVRQVCFPQATASVAWPATLRSSGPASAPTSRRPEPLLQN